MALTGSLAKVICMQLHHINMCCVIIVRKIKNFYLFDLNVFKIYEKIISIGS